MSATTSRPIAVVIPAMNSLGTLPACVAALRKLAGATPFELIVVDNGSTDGTLEWLSNQAGIRVVQEPRRGVAAAVNTGMRAAPNCDIVRVHADAVVETSGWLDALAAAAKGLPKAGIVGAKLTFADDRIESLGRIFVGGAGFHPRHVNIKAHEPDTARTSGKPQEVDGVLGSFCYIKREVLEATGGLDESYWPQYTDDDDLCFHARTKGFKVYVAPAVKVIHYTSTWGPATQVPLHDPNNYVKRIDDTRRVICETHAKLWENKWGWSPLHPDLSEIRRIYGETEVCWRIGEAMRFRPKQWPPSVDVVLITWNNRAVLQRCLESLAKTQYEKVEVFVVDNGSTDDTRPYLSALKEKFPFPLHVHLMDVNTGVPVGFNWAIVQGKGEIVARIDDDVVLPPDWLAKLVEDFKHRPFAGCVGPKILNDNQSRDIQCGPFRLFPHIYGHDNEPDGGQADYFARAAHVRGCCNLYRRDALEKYGLFDVRFSPSQFDDPDHHVCFNVAGLEVLYDGRVSVVHAQTNGASRTYSATSNMVANQSKLLGKWGTDIWSVIDRSLDFSVEGRYLPPDGNTEALTRDLPSAVDFPRPTASVDSERREAQRVALRFREIALKRDGALQPYWNDALRYSSSLRRDGHFSEAARLLHSIVDSAPQCWEALGELADTYGMMGQPERARTLLARALSLAPESPRLAELSNLWSSDSLRPAVRVGADRSHEVGELNQRVAATAKENGLRILIANTFERRTPGGDMGQIRKLQEHLRRVGHHVDVQYSPAPDPTGYDVVHVFNLWFPDQTLPQIKGIRTRRPDVPIVMTPIYWDQSEKWWADLAIPQIFAQSRTPEELRTRLTMLGDGSLLCNGHRRGEHMEANFEGFEEYQRRVLEHVDHLLPQSEREMRNLEQTLGLTIPYTVIRNAAEPDVFDGASPELFVERYGVRDFVLSAGLVENRKNQLLLLMALQGTGIPVVIVGRNYDIHYWRLCQQFAGERTLFLEHLPHEELASAMKAARVFALPSWMECASFACIEAALAGCSLVVSDRTSEPEYFGDCAYYVDPASIDSIRHGVLSAWKNRESDAGRRQRLRERFLSEYTWEKAALETTAAYRAAIESRRGVVELAGV